MTFLKTEFCFRRAFLSGLCIDCRDLLCRPIHWMVWRSNSQYSMLHNNIYSSVHNILYYITILSFRCSTDILNMTRGERHNPFSGFAPLPGPSTFIHTLLFILGYRYHRTSLQHSPFSQNRPPGSSRAFSHVSKRTNYKKYPAPSAWHSSSSLSVVGY